MNAADRFPKTRALIEAAIREYFARQRPALWFWGPDDPYAELQANYEWLQAERAVRNT